MDDFKDRVAVVTGAASGIGLALCKRFAAAGCKVVLADIEPDALNTAEQEIVALGADTLAVVCDVGKADSVSALASAVKERFGNVHILCNNAGVFVGGQIWEASHDDFEWLIDVNQYGVIHGVQSFLAEMINHGEEYHVVNTASMAAVSSLPYAGIYHMTKHAVLALSECLYHELSLAAPQVGISCLCPELFDAGIARSDRNRPDHLGDVPGTDSRQFATEAIVNSTAAGKQPAELAERVFQAIIDRQFYILSDDGWRDVAHSRLDDIRNGRNPTLTAPEV